MGKADKKELRNIFFINFIKYQLNKKKNVSK